MHTNNFVSLKPRIQGQLEILFQPVTGNPPLSRYTRRCQNTTTADVTNRAEEPLPWRVDQPTDSTCLLERTQVCTRAIAGAGNSLLLYFGEATKTKLIFWSACLIEILLKLTEMLPVSVSFGWIPVFGNWSDARALEIGVSGNKPSNWELTFSASAEAAVKSIVERERAPRKRHKPKLCIISPY